MREHAVALLLTAGATGFFAGVAYASWLNGEPFGLVFGILCALICMPATIATVRDIWRM